MRHAWQVVCCLITAAAGAAGAGEESPAPPKPQPPAAAAAAENLIRNGSFEIVAKDKRRAENWGQGGRFQKDDTTWGVDDTTAVDGRYSYRLSGTAGRYLNVAQSIGDNLVSAWTRPLRLSVWVKTKDIAEGPGQYPAMFGIWTHPQKGWNSGTINVARVRGTTAWTRYERVIRREDFAWLGKRAKTEDRLPYRWEVRANLTNQPGTMWIDKVELVRVAETPLAVALDSKAYFADRKTARLTATVRHPDAKPDAGWTLHVRVLDGAGGENCARDQKVAGELVRVELPLSPLAPGRYTVAAELRNAENAVVAEAEMELNKVNGPFADF